MRVISQHLSESLICMFKCALLTSVFNCFINLPSVYAATVSSFLSMWYLGCLRYPLCIIEQLCSVIQQGVLLFFSFKSTNAYASEAILLLHLVLLIMLDYS